MTITTSQRLCPYDQQSETEMYLIHSLMTKTFLVETINYQNILIWSTYRCSSSLII